MATITTPPPRLSGSGSGTGRDGDRRGGGDGPGGNKPRRTYLLGMALGLTSVAMLFIALTSAYIVREGAGDDWRRLHAPPVIWFNTPVLLISSWTLEIARRRRARRWLLATLALGLVFVAGQLAAWRSLAGQGIYLGTNPHSSFFYLLTGAHGLHLLGGIVALAWLAWRTGNHAPLADARGSEAFIPSRDRKEAARIDAVALYWHFMDGLWIYLLALLFLWS